MPPLSAQDCRRDEKILKNNKADVLCLSVAGIVGSFTNTLLVMHFIFLFFRAPFAETRNLATDAVYGANLGHNSG